MESVIEFKLPALGENIEQGDLVRLMIAPGATVSEGQAVMELETDKAVVEVPSSVSGTVKEILVKEGDKIKVGQVIFTADNNGAATVVTRKSAPRANGRRRCQNRNHLRRSNLNLSPRRNNADLLDVPAASEFRLQELGENISQGDLVRLMIAPGAKVSEGQPVMELETDKAVVEVPSSVTGVVNEVKVKEGEKIKVGQVIFTLQGAGSSQAEMTRPQSQPVEHVSGQHGARLAFQAAIRAEGKTEEQALPPDQPMPRPAAFSMPMQLGKVAGTEHREAVPAAPHTRRLARESASIFMKSRARAPADASVKMM
jgi:pyruvate dehydrogenase E2 component (dihydrolipoamide acetyltransferase)